MDLFERGTAWTKEKVTGAKEKLDSPTACEDWNARALVNHLLHGAEIFAGAAQGKPAAPPAGPPPELLEGDPVAEYELARRSVMEAFAAEGAIGKAGPTLGIAFADHLLHGWDLAKGTGQETTMPPDLAEAAWKMIDGRLTDEARGTFFKPPVQVPDDAPAQDKLVGYSGRQP